MKILYFSWVRQKIGKNSEIIHLPKNIENLAQLCDFLSGLGENYREVIAKQANLRFAINHEFAQITDKINDDCEIGIFPPVTGG